MASTLELLASNPNISAAELARAVGVTQDYARTLLRRARSRTTVPAPAQAPARHLAVVEAAQPAAIPAAGNVQAELEQLKRSLQDTQELVKQLSLTPVALRKSLTLNRRSHVLRLHMEGNAPEQIAGKLGIPRGEVDFTLKVDRLAAAGI
jgi:DNA-directed RNA polymerase specialized sigma24 family protein